jgi:hypothetical protein
MKKSNIVLLMIAGILLTTLVAALIVLRKDIRSIIAEAEKELRYYPVEISAFNKLDIPAGWNIKIKQDRQCKVELAAEGNVPIKPNLKNINGRLVFEMDTSIDVNKSANLYARISVQSLKAINAGKGAKILLDNFQFDSLNVVLQDGVILNGKNTGFRNLSLKTNGEVTINLNNIISN